MPNNEWVYVVGFAKLEGIRQADAVLIGGGSGLSSATEYKINIVGKEM